MISDMPLVPTGQLLDNAVRSQVAVPSFNVITVEHAEAIVAGAAEAGVGVLLQVSENAIRFHGAPEPILVACREVAAAAAGPVGLHLDHLKDLDLVERLLARDDLGIGSIMYDGASLDWNDNVATTTAVVADGRQRGWWVEAELGEVGGKDGAHAPGVRTDPEQARDFVAQTGVDGLAVAVGSSHAMRERRASLDLDLIARLRDAVPVPLVLHGSSGVDDAQLAGAVAAGIRKINIGTALNLAGTATLRSWLAEHPDAVDPRAYGGPVRTAMTAVVADLCRMVGQDGSHV